MSVWFDYQNQAWVVDGVYARCGHPECLAHPQGATCYGTLHAGEKPRDEIQAEYNPDWLEKQ